MRQEAKPTDPRRAIRHTAACGNEQRLRLGYELGVGGVRELCNPALVSTELPVHRGAFVVIGVEPLGDAVHRILEASDLGMVCFAVKLAVKLREALLHVAVELKHKVIKLAKLPRRIGLEAADLLG